MTETKDIMEIEIQTYDGLVTIEAYPVSLPQYPFANFALHKGYKSIGTWDLTSIDTGLKVTPEKLESWTASDLDRMIRRALQQLEAQIFAQPWGMRFTEGEIA